MLSESVAPSKLLVDIPDTTSLIAMYLYDETELKEYIQANEDNKLISIIMKKHWKVLKM